MQSTHMSLILSTGELPCTGSNGQQPTGGASHLRIYCCLRNEVNWWPLPGVLRVWEAVLYSL